MRERVVIACLLTVGSSALACSSAMDLGAVDEFPGAGAANGWQSFGQQPSESITLLHHRPTDLAVQDSRLFWTADREGWSDSAGIVQSCAVDDCPASSTTYETTNAAYHALYPPSNVAVDDTTVYWLRGGILHCPIAGCEGKPSVFDTGGNIPARMAVHDDTIYWTSVLNTGVFKCRKTGCDGPPQALALNQLCPFQIEVDDSGVYWHASNQVQACAVGASSIGSAAMVGPIMRVPLDGTGITQVVPDANDLSGMALNATHVYWSVFYTGEIYRCLKTGCDEPELVIAPHGNSLALIVDEAAVYWINAGGPLGPMHGMMSVMKCPLEGCVGATVVAASRYDDLHTQYLAQTPHSMTEDSEHLYWSGGWSINNDVFGGVWRIHK